MANAAQCYTYLPHSPLLEKEHLHFPLPHHLYFIADLCLNFYEDVYLIDQNQTIKTAVSRAVWLPTNRKLLDPDPEKRMELSELPKYLEDKWIR